MPALYCPNCDKIQKVSVDKIMPICDQCGCKVFPDKQGGSFR